MLHIRYGVSRSEEMEVNALCHRKCQIKAVRYQACFARCHLGVQNVYRMTFRDVREIQVYSEIQLQASLQRYQKDCCSYWWDLSTGITARLPTSFIQVAKLSYNSNDFQSLPCWSTLEPELEMNVSVMASHPLVLFHLIQLTF